jgi:hypothetical protein
MKPKAKSNLKSVSFIVRAMSIRLISGEELIGAIAMPSSDTYSVEEAMAMGTHVMVELFYPAKVTTVMVSGEPKIQISKWGTLNNNRHHTIYRQSIMSITPATVAGVELYEKWFKSNYDADATNTIRTAIKEYFGVVEVDNDNKDTDKPFDTYQTSMFSKLDDIAKEYIYGTILKGFSSPVLH